MKSINVVLFVCAVVLAWIAQEALADTGAKCPTTVTFKADDTSFISCPTAPCTHNGKTGTCVGKTMSVCEIPLWKYDAASSKWISAQMVYTGDVEACHCKVNEGTEEEPDYRYYRGPCCDVARVPALDGSSVHSVGLLGTCEYPECNPDKTCVANGTNLVVTADCE